MIWYSHLFQNFPQFIVIHTVKGFGIINKAEIDVFLELSSFSMIQQMLAIWSLALLPFLNPAWTSKSSWFTVLLQPGLENFKHYFVRMWDECNCAVVWALPFFGIGMKTDLFQSCGHCWVFQICRHIEYNTFTASYIRIWKSSTEIPSSPLALLSSDAMNKIIHYLSQIQS